MNRELCWRFWEFGVSLLCIRVRVLGIAMSVIYVACVEYLCILQGLELLGHWFMGSGSRIFLPEIVVCGWCWGLMVGR